MKLTKNQVEDYRRYYIDQPGSDFNPDRNKFLVEETIRKHELEQAKRSNEYEEKIRERVDSAVAYILHLNSTSKNTPLEKYFTRQYLAYLQGQRIVHKMKRLKSGKQIVELEEI